MDLFGIVIAANLCTLAFFVWTVVIVLMIQKKRKQKAIKEFLKKGE